MNTAIVIPARLESTRFPRKVLANIHGRPMLWHVLNNARQVAAAKTFVATDSSEIATAVRDWGGEALLTSTNCASGTERVAATLDRVDADLIVIVQADEPLLRAAVIERLIELSRRCESAVVTPVYRISEFSDLQNPNIVKVVRSASGRALYFSRAVVPFHRDIPFDQWLTLGEFWGHVGVYAFRRGALAAYSKLPRSRLEEFEKLEQLRLLEAGFEIQTTVIDSAPVGVDTPQDLEKATLLFSEEALHRSG